ncbi:hypothetical protein K440DRAFT_373329 [Wilcoxina mikolae CBS 423.85]|nr:hypothetical protein K440DRAFT_373329 [Wilcoxina mikolae CBS 423.85]
MSLTPASGKKRPAPTSPLTPPPTTKRRARNQSCSRSRSRSRSPIGEYPTIEVACAALTNTFGVLKHYENGLWIRHNRIEKREKNAERKEREIEENEVRAKQELGEERRKVQKRERDAERKERETEEYGARAKQDLAEEKVKIHGKSTGTGREKGLGKNLRRTDSCTDKIWKRSRGR